MTMKKYFYQLIILLRTSFHYRFNTVVELLFSNMDLLITVLFWMLIYKSAGTDRLQTYTAADMVIYYLANSVLRRFNLTNSSWEYVSSIKNGTLSAKLLKPCRIGGMIYVRNLALAVTGMLPAALFILAAGTIFSVQVSWHFALGRIPGIVVMLILSSISSHLVWSLLGFLSFWSEEGSAVIWSFMVIFNFLSGMFLPLDFFPEGWLSVLEILPPASWGYLPTKILLGQYSLVDQQYLILMHAAWCVILGILKEAVWRAGLKRYSSVGA